MLTQLALRVQRHGFQVWGCVRVPRRLGTDRVSGFGFRVSGFGFLRRFEWETQELTCIAIKCEWGNRTIHRGQLRAGPPNPSKSMYFPSETSLIQYTSRDCAQTPPDLMTMNASAAEHISDPANKPSPSKEKPFSHRREVNDLGSDRLHYSGELALAVHQHSGQMRVHKCVEGHLAAKLLTDGANDEGAVLRLEASGLVARGDAPNLLLAHT
jgi:hypothetical protein